METQVKQVIIRNAELNDLVQLKQLFAQLIDNVHPTIHSMEDVMLDIYDDNHNSVFVVEVNGRIVGTAQVIIYENLIRTPKRKAIVDSVIVDESMRGLNLGKQLLTHLIDYCKSLHVGKISLVSSYRRYVAYSFYRSMGFKDCGLGFEMDLS